MNTPRIVIYPKDIQRITGKSERSVRKLMASIRSALGKQKHQLISVTDFCTYIGLNKEEVERQLNRF